MTVVAVLVAVILAASLLHVMAARRWHRRFFRELTGLPVDGWTWSDGIDAVGVDWAKPGGDWSAYVVLRRSPGGRFTVLRSERLPAGRNRR